MKALTFHFSYPRFVAGKLFGGLSRGGPLVYEDVPDAKLLGDDWVIVETRYCGICGSDVKQAYLEGAFDNPMTAVISFPHVLGHEVVGTVVEAGKDVRQERRSRRLLPVDHLRGARPTAVRGGRSRALSELRRRSLLGGHPRNGARSVRAVGVGQNRPDESATLCAGRTHYSNDFFVAHLCLLGVEVPWK
jgi:hypothetical protein